MSMYDLPQESEWLLKSCQAAYCALLRPAPPQRWSRRPDGPAH